MRTGLFWAQALFWISLAIVQMAAIEAGLQEAFRWHWFPATIVGMVLGITPFLGSAAGIWGAMEGFRWGLGLALTVLIGVPLVGGYALAKLKRLGTL